MKGVFSVLVAAGTAVACSGEINLDAPAWPAVKPEYWPDAQTKVEVLGSYFQGRMIKSPEDVVTGGKHHEFHLRRTFSLKARPAMAWLQFMADDSCVVFLNGKVAGRSSTWEVPTLEEVSDALVAGENAIAITYRNARSAGGVLFELFVRYPDGSFERVNSDEGFRTSVSAAEGWKTAGFDASGWRPVESFDPPPTPPWKKLLSYKDFAHPQELVAMTGLPDEVEAGAKVRIDLKFRGACPNLPFEGVIRVAKEGAICYDERFVVSEKDVAKGEDGIWTLSVPFEFPLYTTGGRMTVSLEAGSVFIGRGKPIARTLMVRPAVTIPGYEKPVRAGTRTDGGQTRFVIDGEAFAPLWGGVARRNRADKLPRHGDAPLNLVTVYAADWWPSTNGIDFTAFDSAAELYRRSNRPDAWYMFDLTVYPPNDWIAAHPDEQAREDDGTVCRDGRPTYSFASRPAVELMKGAVEQAIRYLEGTPYANRIIGYRVNSGHTIEWLGWDPRRGHTLDFSRPTAEAFAKWARVRYPQLKETDVPSYKSRLSPDGRVLWQPADHLQVVAFNEFYSEQVADDLIELCMRAKELVGGRKLVGTYYGYTMTLHANGDSQMRAHYALKKVLDAKCVDFLMSPQAYGPRELGNTDPDMKPFATLSAAGVVPVIEDDTRTHNGPYITYSGNHQTITLEQSVGMLRRNMGVSACRGVPQYYYALCAGTEFDFPEFARDAASLRAVESHCISKGTSRRAEVAIVVSEKAITSMPMLTGVKGVDCRYSVQRFNRDGSVRTEAVRSGPFANESFYANYTRYARAGAPTDYLLAEDFVERPGDYKLYVFANQFTYDDRFLAAVRKLQERDCTILWVYAPGLTVGGRNAESNMKALTGLTLREMPGGAEAGAKMSDGRTMGAAGTVSPMFRAEDADEVLGRYPDGSAAVAVLKTGRATSVFSGVWQFDVPFLTELYRRAGVHIYSESSDPIEANGNLVALHARFPGAKTIRLPRKTDVIDVFNRRLVAKGVESFAFEAPLHSSWLFYCADDAEDVLKKIRAAEVR